MRKHVSYLTVSLLMITGCQTENGLAPNLDAVDASVTSVDQNPVVEPLDDQSECGEKEMGQFYDLRYGIPGATGAAGKTGEKDELNNNGDVSVQYIEMLTALDQNDPADAEAQMLNNKMIGKFRITVPFYPGLRLIGAKVQYQKFLDKTYPTNESYYFSDFSKNYLETVVHRCNLSSAVNISSVRKRNGLFATIFSNSTSNFIRCEVIVDEIPEDPYSIQITSPENRLRFDVLVEPNGNPSNPKIVTAYVPKFDYLIEDRQNKIESIQYSKNGQPWKPLTPEVIFLIDDIVKFRMISKPTFGSDKYNMRIYYDRACRVCFTEFNNVTGNVSESLVAGPFVVTKPFTATFSCSKTKTPPPGLPPGPLSR